MINMIGCVLVLPWMGMLPVNSRRCPAGTKRQQFSGEQPEAERSYPGVNWHFHEVCWLGSWILKPTQQVLGHANNRHCGECFADLTRPTQTTAPCVPLHCNHVG